MALAQGVTVILDVTPVPTGLHPLTGVFPLISLWLISVAAVVFEGPAQEAPWLANSKLVG